MLVGLGRYFVRTRRNSRRIQPKTIWCPQADFLRLHSAFRETLAHGIPNQNRTHLDKFFISVRCRKPAGAGWTPAAVVPITDHMLHMLHCAYYGLYGGLENNPTHQSCFCSPSAARSLILTLRIPIWATIWSTRSQPLLLLR